MEAEKQSEGHLLRYQNWKEGFDACFPTSEPCALIGIKETEIGPNADQNFLIVSDSTSSNCASASETYKSQEESNEGETITGKEGDSRPDIDDNNELEINVDFIPGSPIAHSDDDTVQDLSPDLIPDVIEDEKSILKEMVIEFEQSDCFAVPFETSTSFWSSIEDLDTKVTIVIKSIVAKAHERYEDDLTSSNVAAFTTYAAIQLDRIKAINDLRTKRHGVVETIIQNRCKIIEASFGLDWWNKTEEEVERLYAKDDPGEMSILRSFGEEWVGCYRELKKEKLKPLSMVLKQLKSYEQLVFSWLGRDICCDDSKLESYHNEAWTSAALSPEAGVHSMSLIPKILEIADHIISQLESTNRNQTESEIRIARQAVEHTVAKYCNIITRKTMEPLSPMALQSLHDEVSSKVIDSFYGVSDFVYTHPWEQEKDALVKRIAIAFEEYRKKNDFKRSQVFELEKAIQTYVTDFSASANQLFLKEVTESDWDTWLGNYWEATSESFKVKMPDVGAEAIAKLRTRIHETIVRLGIKERLQTVSVIASGNFESQPETAEISTDINLQPTKQFSHAVNETAQPVASNIIVDARSPLVSNIVIDAKSQPAHLMPSLLPRSAGAGILNSISMIPIMPQTKYPSNDYLFQSFSIAQTSMKPLSSGTEPRIVTKPPATELERLSTPCSSFSVPEQVPAPVTTGIRSVTVSKTNGQIFVPARVLLNSAPLSTGAAKHAREVTQSRSQLAQAPKSHKLGTSPKIASEQAHLRGIVQENVQPIHKRAPIAQTTQRVSMNWSSTCSKVSRSPALPKSTIRLIDTAPRTAAQICKDRSPRTPVTPKGLTPVNTPRTFKSCSPWRAFGTQMGWSPRREAGSPKPPSQREAFATVCDWSPPVVPGKANDWTPRDSPGNGVGQSPIGSSGAWSDWSPRQVPEKATDWSPRKTPTASRNPSPKAELTLDHEMLSKHTSQRVAEWVLKNISASPKKILTEYHQRVAALKRTLNLDSEDESSSEKELAEIRPKKLQNSFTSSSESETIPLMLPKQIQRETKFYQLHPNAKLISPCGIGIVFCCGKAHISVKASNGAKNFTVSSQLYVMQGLDGPVFPENSGRGTVSLEIYEYLTKPHFMRTIRDYWNRNRRRSAPLWAEEVMGIFFYKLKKQIQTLCKRDLIFDEIVIALPGFISSSCKQRLKSSLQLAGFKKSLFVQTTTAIGTTYLESNPPESELHILVIWIQLITIDVALLKVSNGKVSTIGADATVSFSQKGSHYNLVDKLPNLINSVIYNGGIKKKDVARCVYAIEDSLMASNSAEKGINSLVIRVHEAIHEGLDKHIIIIPCSILEGMLPGLVSISSNRSAFGPNYDSYIELFRHEFELDSVADALKGKIPILSAGAKAEDKTVLVPASQIGLRGKQSYICSRSAECVIKEIGICVSEIANKSTASIKISINREGIISASLQVVPHCDPSSLGNQSLNYSGQHMPLDLLKEAGTRVKEILDASQDMRKESEYYDSAKKRRWN